jgi:hypothetical protein
MSMRFRLVLTAFAALLAAPVFSATITVEGVVSPAWVERAGAGRVPLEVGMTLENTDKVHTGRNSRALLRIADGSAVKLGEDAVLGLDGLSDRKDERARRLVTASLDVVRGAFRFTTGIFGKGQAGRDVRIRFATVTAGVRGTDLWGKSETKQDLVCLIEGRISVNHAQTGEFTMSEPLAFFVAPRQAKPLPVGIVDKRQLEEWAKETELDTAAGGARRGGGFAVIASVSPDQESALRDYDTLRNAGFPATIRPVRKNEYRLRITGIATQRDALALVEKLKTLGMAQAAVGR